MKTIVAWFEIPALDIDRAKKFYSKVLGIEMNEQEMGGHKMAFFPMEGMAMSGCLIQGDGCTPSMDGVLVYLSAGDNLSGPLSKVEEAGGKIVMPKTIISEEIGYFAIFKDTEGNRIAFYSKN